MTRILLVVISTTIVGVQHLRSLSDLGDVLLLAVALAVVAVPEGLTAITTITSANWSASAARAEELRGIWTLSGSDSKVSLRIGRHPAGTRP